ncbi:MAG: hypothetical protein C5B51_12945 [Terriglobia bacterium]|nr:MAG: hypothetical protein C5B51_12945 [Terriglobia bacterium]
MPNRLSFVKGIGIGPGLTKDNIPPDSHCRYHFDRHADPMPESTPQRNQHLEFAENLIAGSLTVFGRLVSAAGLRDPRTGRYQHALLSRLLDADSMQDVLYRLHRKCFLEWLALTLAQQRGDLTRTFDRNPSGTAASVLLWLDHHLYQSLIPADTPSYESELFTHDIWLALQSIQYDFEPRKARYELDTEADAAKPSQPPKRSFSWLAGWKKSQWSTP